jgi:porphobilinogen deaminase
MERKNRREFLIEALLATAGATLSSCTKEDGTETPVSVELIPRRSSQPVMKICNNTKDPERMQVLGAIKDKTTTFSLPPEQCTLVNLDTRCAGEITINTSNTQDHFEEIVRIPPRRKSRINFLFGQKR